MPPKIRELENMLLKAGFIMSPGKGSHRHFIHPCGAKVTLSGQRGDDAQHYQIKDVNQKNKTGGKITRQP